MKTEAEIKRAMLLLKCYIHIRREEDDPVVERMLEQMHCAAGCLRWALEERDEHGELIKSSKSFQKTLDSMEKLFGPTLDSLEQKQHEN